MTTTDQPTRRYAHEVVPHLEEGQGAPLDYLARYHYAQAIGWWNAFVEAFRNPGPASNEALGRYVTHSELGFLYDALTQGLQGQDAADWACERNHSESIESVGERAVAHGLEIREIRSYSDDLTERHVS